MDCEALPWDSYVKDRGTELSGQAKRTMRAARQEAVEDGTGQGGASFKVMELMCDRWYRALDG